MKKFIHIVFCTIFLLNIFFSPCIAAQTENLEGVIVYIELDGDIYLLVGETNTHIQLTNDAGSYHYQSPKFSPDGNLLAFLRNDPEKGEFIFDLYVMDLKNKNFKKLAENVNSLGNFSWATNSQSIVFAYSLDIVCKTPDQDTSLGIFQVDVNTGTIEEIIPATTQNTPLKDPVFSNDGNWIFFSSFPCFSEGWTIHTQNLINGETYNFALGQLDWIPGKNSLAWTQEGSNGSDGEVYLISSDQKQKELFYKADNLSVTSPHWSPDGKWLVLRQYTEVEGFFISDEEMENWVDELVLITEDGYLKDTLCTTKTVNACQFHIWSPSGDAVIFSLNEDGQQKWQIYSMETERLSTLAYFGEGGVDWAMNVQLPEIVSTIESTMTYQNITNTPSFQTEIQSTPTMQTEIEFSKSNIFIFIISGICLFMIAILVAAFLVFYLRKNKNN